jgi:hypothetical protein
MRLARLKMGGEIMARVLPFPRSEDRETIRSLLRSRADGKIWEAEFSRQVGKEEIRMRQSLDRFSASLTSECLDRRPVAECLTCGAEIYPGQEYLEIWPGMSGRDVVCSRRCAEWAWHVLRQEDRIRDAAQTGYVVRVAEEAGAPWWE